MGEVTVDHVGVRCKASVAHLVRRVLVKNCQQASCELRCGSEGWMRWSGTRFAWM